MWVMWGGGRGNGNFTHCSSACCCLEQAWKLLASQQPPPMLFWPYFLWQSPTEAWPTSTTPPQDGTMDILLSKKPYNVQEYKKVAGSNIVFLFKGLSLVVPYIPFWVVVELEKWTSKPITKNGNQNLRRNSMYMPLLLLLFFVVRCVYINPKNASTQFYGGNVQPNPRTFEAATMQFTGSKIESPTRWT